MMQALTSTLVWTLRRLSIVALVSISLSGVAQSPESGTASGRGLAAQPAGLAMARTAAPAGADVAAVQVAAAASAAHGLHGPMPASADLRTVPADPPAFILFVAALLAVIFISTRRRKDR